jgi:ABC-type glycerol-3-phosphate transport system substrate-binding protein
LSSEAPTETPSEAPSATSRDSCNCTSCHQQIRIVASSEFQAYFDFHIAEYQSRNPNISIELEVLEVLESRNQKDELFQALQQRLLSDSEDDDENDIPANDKKWDGAMFPAHMMGTLEDVLWDLDEYLASSSQNQETMPYFQRHAQYGNTTKILPLDGNTVHMYYRKD